MKILNTLLIGLGDIGMGYDLQTPKDLILTHAKAVSLDKDFKLVAGVDPNKNKRDIFEKKYKTITFPSISEVNLSEKKFPLIAKKVEINFLENKDSFSEKDWKNLYKLSENTFVEETESLKQGAAGAGLTDND